MTNSKRPLIKWCIGISILLIIFSFSFIPDRYLAIARGLKIFASVYKKTYSNYVDPLNPTKLMRSGIDRMLANLDPYTNYISENQIEDIKTQYAQEYAGIGALVQIVNKRVIVTTVYKDTPASLNGLRAGDEVIQIDQSDMAQLTQEDVHYLLYGQAGTFVTLQIKRPGVNELMNIKFKREKVNSKAVPYSNIIYDNMGYIKFTEFSAHSSQTVQQALIQLKEEGAESIILDLRNNQGGLVVEAVNICNLFIPKGKPVVSTKGRHNEKVYKTTQSPTDLTIPLVVLINKKSASASEIVAGTLQDYDRAIIMGEKSFGKGLVQVPLQLPYQSQVKITTAKYYIPSGRCIQKINYSQSTNSLNGDTLVQKEKFFTSQGRPVYSGGAIQPDITIPEEAHSAIVAELIKQGYLLHYAALYSSTRSTLPKPQEFALTDQDYQHFVTWIKNQPFHYVSELEDQTHQLNLYTQDMPVTDTIQSLLKELRRTLARKKNTELLDSKMQIKHQLEKYICSHFYFEHGALKSEFKYDQILHKAADVLTKKSYLSILNPTQKKDK